MARLQTLEPVDFPEEYKEFLGPEIMAERDKMGIMRIWAQRPDISMAFRTFTATVFANSLLSRRTIELLRLRVAFHNQCRSCMAIRYSPAVQAGVTEELVCELANPEEGPNISEAERVALRYADLMATNHLAIDDAIFNEMRKHFSEPEIIEIGTHIAYCIGFGRLGMSWDMVDDLPARFHDRTELVTPWGEDATVV